MFDGSIRSRLLLYGGESEECYVNMTYSKFAHVIFSEVYNKLFGDYLEENFVYARKYEKLSVNKQFYPIYFIDEDSTSGNQEIKDINNKYLRAMHEHNKKTGKDIVITDDRIPKVGLYLIDDKTLTLNYGEVKRDTILSGLFSSSFLDIGSYYVDL